MEGPGDRWDTAQKYNTVVPLKKWGKLRVEGPCGTSRLPCVPSQQRKPSVRKPQGLAIRSHQKCLRGNGKCTLQHLLQPRSESKSCLALKSHHAACEVTCQSCGNLQYRNSLTKSCLLPPTPCLVRCQVPDTQYVYKMHSTECIVTRILACRAMAMSKYFIQSTQYPGRQP